MLKKQRGEGEKQQVTNLHLNTSQRVHFVLAQTLQMAEERLELKRTFKILFHKVVFLLHKDSTAYKEQSAQ